MTGLPVEQILKFGELEQGAQQLNNQSSAAISDAMYKQALESYYDTQGRNTRANTLLDYEIQKERNALIAERNMYQNAGDLAKVLETDQKIRMLEKGIHPTQTGTAAANRMAAASERRAATGERSENRNIAQYLLDEERYFQGRGDKRIEQKLAQDKFYLDQIRERRLQATSEAERRKYELQEQATLTGWLTDAAEADDQFTAEALVGSYYEHAPQYTTRIPYYKEGLFTGKPQFGEFVDEDGTVMTLGDFKVLAEEAGGTTEEVIRFYVENSKGK